MVRCRFGGQPAVGVGEERKYCVCCFFFSSRRRHTRFDCDWSSDVCSSDLVPSPKFQTCGAKPTPPGSNDWSKNWITSNTDASNGKNPKLATGGGVTSRRNSSEPAWPNRPPTWK